MRLLVNTNDIIEGYHGGPEDYRDYSSTSIDMFDGIGVSANESELVQRKMFPLQDDSSLSVGQKHQLDSDHHVPVRMRCIHK